MKAFKIDDSEYLISTEKGIYYIWDFYDQIVIDHLKAFNQDLIWQKVIYSDYDAKGLPIKQIKMINDLYQNITKYPEIKLEQFLTHQNKNLREIIKEFLDGSL